MIDWDISKVQRTLEKTEPPATHQEGDQLSSGSSTSALFDIHPVYNTLLPLP